MKKTFLSSIAVIVALASAYFAFGNNNSNNFLQATSAENYDSFHSYINNNIVDDVALRAS